MPDLEQGCRWHFGPEGPNDQGPTNPSKGAFKSTPEINVVREAVQNSLDARPKGSAAPARVSFRLERLRREDFPAFFGLRDHVQSVLEYYPKSKRAKEKFPRMAKALESDSIPVLVIGDSGTTGMAYRSGDTGCAFYAFAQSIGVSAAKDEGSGGSNGLGKNTLFEFSPIRSLLISSRTEDGTVVFQGKAELATHLDPSGSGLRVSKFGAYGFDAREPVTDDARIPALFRRSEPGSDIRVVGVDDSKQDTLRNGIVRAVLNHFWMSVRDGMLEADVLGCAISRETLAARMAEFFPAQGEPEGQVGNYVKWTPVPYWRAVENAESGKPQTAVERAERPRLGDVVLYLDWGAVDLPKRVVYMRKPRMAIFKKGKQSYPPFAAVFVCLSDAGNELLKDSEPPDHGSWDAANYEGEDAAPRKQAVREALDFVDAMLEKHLRGEATKNEIVIPGLAELLPDVKDRADGGERGTVGSGASDGLQPSGDLSSKETAAPVSWIDPATGKPVEPRERETPGSANGLVEDVAPSGGGTPETTFAGEKPGEPNPNPGHGPQEAGTPVESGIAPAQGESANILLRVTARVGTRRGVDGRLWHRVFVKPAPGEAPARCAAATLSLLSGGDNGKPEELVIESVRGVPGGAFDAGSGEIRRIDIGGGAAFDVLFRDKFPHSVKVVAHANLR